MSTCEDCENFAFYTAMGPIEGFCRAIPDDKPGRPGKVVRFDTNADKCNKFLPLEEKVTDLRSYYYDSGLRFDASKKTD